MAQLNPRAIRRKGEPVIEIGARLRELREARKLSQGDIEERTGLLRCYVSRVECGHTIPSLETLERVAKALDVELYQLFYSGGGKPAAPKVHRQNPLLTEERNLVEIFRRISPPDKKLLLELARYSERKRRRRT
jgi:transcriptional regulator with XRE-family HTH domain